jgi:hypothetical protein
MRCYFYRSEYHLQLRTPAFQVPLFKIGTGLLSFSITPVDAMSEPVRAIFLYGEDWMPLLWVETQIVMQSPQVVVAD